MSPSFEKAFKNAINDKISAVMLFAASPSMLFINHDVIQPSVVPNTFLVYVSENPRVLGLPGNRVLYMGVR